MPRGPAWWVAFLSVLFLFPSTARSQGGPPLLTDDPGTPGDGVWEVNLAFTVEKRRSVREFEAPVLDLNYGIGERIQLKFEVPWIFLEEDGSTRNGLGNSLVGLKWRFLDQDRHEIDLSVYPQFEFNSLTSSAERGLVEEGMEFFLPFELQRDLGRFSINPEAGFAFHEGEGDHWVLGLAAGYQAVPERLELLGEVRTEIESDSGDDETVFNLGTRVSLWRRFKLLVSGGRSFRHSSSGEPDLLLYLGLQVLFGKTG